MNKTLKFPLILLFLPLVIPVLIFDLIMGFGQHCANLSQEYRKTLK